MKSLLGTMMGMIKIPTLMKMMMMTRRRGRRRKMGKGKIIGNYDDE